MTVEVEQLAAGWALFGTVGYLVCQAAYQQLSKRYAALASSPKPPSAPLATYRDTRRSDNFQDRLDSSASNEPSAHTECTDRHQDAETTCDEHKRTQPSPGAVGELQQTAITTSTSVTNNDTKLGQTGKQASSNTNRLHTSHFESTKERSTSYEKLTAQITPQIASLSSTRSLKKVDIRNSDNNSSFKEQQYRKNRKDANIDYDTLSNLKGSHVPPQQLVFETRVTPLFESGNSPDSGFSRQRSTKPIENRLVAPYSQRSDVFYDGEHKNSSLQHREVLKVREDKRENNHKEPYSSDRRAIANKRDYTPTRSVSIVQDHWHSEYRAVYNKNSAKSRIRTVYSDRCLSSGNNHQCSSNLTSWDPKCENTGRDSTRLSVLSDRSSKTCHSPADIVDCNEFSADHSGERIVASSNVVRRDTRVELPKSNCTGTERSQGFRKVKVTPPFDWFKPQSYLERNRFPRLKDSELVRTSMDPDDTSPETAVEADENDPQQHQELDTSNLDIVQAPDEDPNEMEHTENLSNEFIHQTGVPGEREDQDKQSSELDDEKVDEETKEERRLISPPLCSEEEKPDGTTQGSESTLNRVEAEEESFETPASENQAAQSEQDITDQITSPNKVDIVTAGGSQETGCADGHEAAVSGGCAPSFITELTSVEYTAGSALQLVAQVTGQPLPDAVWKKDGAVIDLSGRVNAENEDGALTLSVTLTSPKDAGQYTVEVFNEHGRVKSEAEVVLQKPEPGAPEFSLQVKDVIQTPSGSVEFSARVSGQPKPKVHWQFNDKPIKAGPNYKLERDEDLCKLFISECNEELAGRYACVAKNSAGLARSEATLQVMDQLPVDNTEESVAEVEQPSQLTEELVQAQPERQSRGNEEQIIERKIIREETNVEDNEKTAQRKTKALTEEMENDISHVERRKKTAKKEAPHFLKTIGDTEVFNGMQAKFTACVSGQPLPEFEWYRDGIRIYPSDRIAMSLDETGVVRLVMRSVDSTDAGRYRLRVINSQGEADCEADLTFESFESINIRPMKDQYKTLEWQLKSGVPMPLVDAPIISRMTDCQLVLSWRPSPPVGQTVPVTYQVEMTEVTANEWQVIRTGVRGCSIEVKELFPDKDYRFRVKVENKYGVSEPSAHVTTQREKLIVPLQTPEEFLPSGERFRPGISTKFPENFDMERWNNRRPQPPMFLIADCNIQASLKGECAQLKWQLFGYPMPDIRFSFNNCELSMTDRYGFTLSKDGNLVLSIAKMGDRDQGVYEAIASNKYGEARQRVILQLAVRPRLTQLPEETTVLLRSQARLEARITGFPTPQVTWFKNWEPVVHSEKVRVLWREPETAILLINGCTSRDTGLYSVSVRNKAGVTSASVMLHVEHDELNYNYQSYSALRSVRPRNKAFEDFYDIGDEIGRGTQGIVYHVVERSNGRSFAAKCMNGKGDQRLAMNAELWIMNQLFDRCIVRLYDAYESPRQLILVQELCSGGDVLSTFCQQSTINESDVANVMRQVLWALLHMHTKHVAHLGLTPCDILFSRCGGEEVKICDFSYSRHVNPERPERLEYGMPEYVAPEVVNGETVGLSADIWSVGVITYLLLSGSSPFRGKTDKETLIKIKSGDMDYDTEAFANISDQAKDFVAKMLVFSPAGRLDVKQALKHPWLKFADKSPSTLNEISTEKLAKYRDEFKNWLNTSVCETWFRRRALSSALAHPAGHLYPREVEYTPPPSPEPARNRKWHVPAAVEEQVADVDEEPQLVMESLEPNLGWLGTESHYQQGPDTFLVQLRETGLPSRLREYVKVACQRSPYLATRTLPASTDQFTSDSGNEEAKTTVEVTNPWWRLPLLHERRRFTDIMDEEMDAGRRSRIDKYSAVAAHGDSPAQRVPRRLRYDIPGQQPSLNNDEAAMEIQRQRQMPYFREKPTDEALTRDGHCLVTCYAVGDPAPVVQWFRNDVPISESKRIRLYQTREGRSALEILNTIDYDLGVYRAVARNSTGQSVVYWRMYMGDAPGSMDMPEVAEYSDTEALLRWTVPYLVDNAPIIAYSLQMKQLIEHQWTTVADNITHEFMCVENLRPECNYQFRLRARNKFGFGPFSVPTPTCRTRKQGWTKKVALSLKEHYLQSVTELGAEPAGMDCQQCMDYETEDFPVALLNEWPQHKYKFIEQIHRGKMSAIALCVDLTCNQLNAAKVLDASDANCLAALHEFETLRSLRHQRVAQLFDAFRLDTRLVLVLEALQGTDILRFFHQQHEYTEQLVAAAVSQVLDGLQYLHWRGLVHLNLQPANIVAASRRRFGFKLVDLGQCQRVSRLGRMVPAATVTAYTAPELLVDEPVFPSTDIWSLGVVLYVLLSGSSPFDHPSPHAMRQNVLYVRVPMQNLYQEVTPEVSRFLTLIFRRGPSKRPTCEECMEHRWLSASEFMQKRRQRAVFFGNRLKEYSEQYHCEKRAAQSHSAELLAGFGLSGC